MFGGGFWGAPLAGGDDHLAKEREPPPRPIKLEFPEYVPKLNPRNLDSRASSQLRHKICHSRSFSDISDADIESLNICFEKNVSISSLLPNNQFVSRPLPFDDELQAMLDEIGTENEDAFREVLRVPPLPGHKKPRLAYARNFFGSLEDMARYFDDSKDQYYQVPVEPSSKSGGIEPRKLSIGAEKDVVMKDSSSEPLSDENPITKEVYKGYRISSAESLSPGTRISMLKNLLKTTMHRFQCRDHETIPQPREKLTIRGVKIQSIQYQFCVARIPQDVKLARARQVEGPIMAVASREDLRFKEKTGLESPEKTPFVGERFDLFKEVGCMLIVAAQRSREGGERLPSAPEKWWVSKQRWGGGPTKWGQLASEFYEDEDPSWSPEEKKLQDDKRRQQAEDKSRGADSKPIDLKKLDVDDLIVDDDKSDGVKATALPGIPAGSTSGTPVVATDLDIRPRKKKLRSMERPPGNDAEMRDGKRLMYIPPFRKKWYDDWQKLRPNAPTADDKIISKRVGTEHEEFDEIFMLTSVNHHVAIAKLRVHPDYLAWLENGTAVSDETVGGMKKNILYSSRTKWFDMFNVEVRKDFLVGLWRVFCWMNRDYVPQNDNENEKVE